MKSVKRNIFYSMLYQIFLIITPLITAPYLSRVLGPDKIGIQSYTSSVQAYFLMAAALGTMTYGARAIAQHRDSPQKYTKLFWEIELLTVITSFISMCFWAVLILCSGTEYRAYYIAMSLNLLAAMFDISWFFSGMEEFKLIVIRNFFFRVLGIFLMFAFIKSEEDLFLYIFILATSGLLSSLSTWTYLPKFLVKIEWKKLSILPHFKETLVYFIPSIATSVYTVLDRVLIGIITGDEAANGYYAQAEKVISLAKSIAFTAINSVVSVRISYLFSENKIQEIHNRIQDSINYILFMSIGCMFGMIAVAKNFVPLFFGTGYEPVVNLLYLFSPIVVIIGVSNCAGSHYYTPSGKRAQSAKFIVAGAAVNFVVNLCLIPIWGAMGAAVASVLAELVISILYVKNSNGFLTLQLLFTCAWKKFLAGFIMLWAVLLVDVLVSFNDIICLLAQVLVGALLYVILLLALKDKGVLLFLNSTIRSVRKNLGLKEKG